MELSGIAIYYFTCRECQFTFAPEFENWKESDFSEHIYNEQYTYIDPDYTDIRPRNNAELLDRLFGIYKDSITHLDFGGGNHLLSKLLRQKQWTSTSFDPFAEDRQDLSSLGHFNLLSAFEVFEHSPNTSTLMDNLCSLLTDDGIIIFSTLASDGNIAPRQRLSWWYAAPRNGHVSLFSRKSLFLLGARHGFRFGSFSANLHVFWRQLPFWAAHLVKGPVPPEQSR